MQEAMEMTQEEMDRAAHHLLMLNDESLQTAGAPGAAARTAGNQPLMVALNAAYTEVDEVPHHHHRPLHKSWTL